MYESDILTFMAPRLSGWLWKKSEGTFAQWKRHWCVSSLNPKPSYATYKRLPCTTLIPPTQQIRPRPPRTNA